MSVNEKVVLKDHELELVSGGAHSKSKAEGKKAEFDQAWNLLGMERKGYSGMARAELYDKWESNDYSTDATTFITLETKAKS